jgi:hypothetical protein
MLEVCFNKIVLNHNILSHETGDLDKSEIRCLTPNKLISSILIKVSPKIHRPNFFLSAKKASPFLA